MYLALFVAWSFLMWLDWGQSWAYAEVLQSCPPRVEGVDQMFESVTTCAMSTWNALWAWMVHRHLECGSAIYDAVK